jgi:hypothetical protein
MDNFDKLDFDIFEFREKTNQRELTCMTALMLQKHSLYTGLKIPFEKFLKFMDKIQSGYNDVKYHNQIHAADVTQTLYYITFSGGWVSKGKLDNIDI